MKWKRVKTYDELWEYVKESWTVIATLTVSGDVNNINVQKPKSARIYSRTGKDYKLGAITMVLQIPNPSNLRLEKHG